MINNTYMDDFVCQFLVNQYLITIEMTLKCFDLKTKQWKLVAFEDKKIVSKDVVAVAKHDHDKMQSIQIESMNGESLFVNNIDNDSDNKVIYVMGDDNIDDFYNGINYFEWKCECSISIAFENYKK